MELDRRLQERERKQLNLLKKHRSDWATHTNDPIFPHDPKMSLRMCKWFVDDAMREFRRKFPLGREPTFEGAFTRIEELGAWHYHHRYHEPDETRLYYLSRFKYNVMSDWMQTHHPGMLEEIRARKGREWDEIFDARDRVVWYPSLWSHWSHQPPPGLNRRKWNEHVEERKWKKTTAPPTSPREQLTSLNARP